MSIPVLKGGQPKDISWRLQPSGASILFLFPVANSYFLTVSDFRFGMNEPQISVYSPEGKEFDRRQANWKFSLRR